MLMVGECRGKVKAIKLAGSFAVDQELIGFK